MPRECQEDTDPPQQRPSALRRLAGDVAVLGSDGISDAVPGPGVEGWPMPLHQCCLVAMGIHLLDNLRFDLLGAACAERERWEFLLTIAPLPVAGGTGSPVNPIAVF
jgi:hypothetical protein